MLQLLRGAGLPTATRGHILQFIGGAILARPTKQGLDYFPFDVGFFGDNNVRILKARYRSDGVAVYVKILCDVYREGYFLPVECWDDYVYVMADEIGATLDKVEQIITFLQSRAMVRIYRKGKDELTGLDVDAVITSHGIQKRYAAAMKSRRKKSVSEIKRGFWLLSEDEENEINAFYKSGNNAGLSEKNPSYSENNPNKSEKNPTKESKRKEDTDGQHAHASAHTREGASTATAQTSKPAHPQPLARREFFAQFPYVADDPTVDDTAVDYLKMSVAFNRSKKLLQNRRSLAWLVQRYPEIVAGKYDDFPEATPAPKPAPPVSEAVQAANDRTDRERWYSARRIRAENEAVRARARAEKNFDFKEAEKKLRRIEIAIAKATINAPDSVPELQAEKDFYTFERAKALFVAGVTEEDLRPKWYCEKCSDTGFLPSGAGCDCYARERQKNS